MNIENIKKLKCWVLYRMKVRGNRMTKIPVSPKTGKAASVTDSTQWTDYNTAVAAQQKYGANGVGIVFDEAAIEGDLHLTGLDIDHCIDIAGRSATPIAIEIGRKLNSYTEFSPSQTGVHILALSSISAGCKSPQYGLEIYSNNRFFTFTGNRIPSLNEEICDGTAQIKEIIAKYFPKECLQNNKMNPPPCALSEGTTPLEDDGILEKMFNSRQGERLRMLFNGNLVDYHNDHSSADFALARQLAYWTNKNLPQMDRLFRRSGLMRLKWDSPRGSSTYGMMTLQKALS